MTQSLQSLRAHRKGSLLLDALVPVTVGRLHLERVSAEPERIERQQLFDGHLAGGRVRDASDILRKIHDLFVRAGLVDFIFNRTGRLLCGLVGREVVKLKIDPDLFAAGEPASETRTNFGTTNREHTTPNASAGP